MLNLQKATVVGYFSLPSLSLAEHNPTAYNNAMSDAPEGAGSCGHCGTGILHHTVIRLEDGSRAFIGTSCAEKVGTARIKSCIRQKMTEEQMLAREQRVMAHRLAQWAEWETDADKQLARYESYKDIIDALAAHNTDFHTSLAHQLLYRNLTWRQAEYATKAVVGRRTKKTAEQWDEVYEKCMSE